MSINSLREVIAAWLDASPG